MRALARYAAWRESSFLRNPRLRVARGATVAAASVASHEVYARSWHAADAVGMA